MAKLTDKQKKKIVAIYAETENYSETARITGVSRITVHRVIESMADIDEIVQNKKEENTESVLAFMDSKKNDVCNLIDKLLEAMNDEDKIKATSLSQLATTMGIVIDKYTMNDKTLKEESGKIVLEIHRPNEK